MLDGNLAPIYPKPQSLLYFADPLWSRISPIHGRFRILGLGLRVVPLVYGYLSRDEVESYQIRVWGLECNLRQNRKWTCCATAWSNLATPVRWQVWPNLLPGGRRVPAGLAIIRIFVPQRSQAAKKVLRGPGPMKKKVVSIFFSIILV